MRRVNVHAGGSGVSKGVGLGGKATVVRKKALARAWVVSIGVRLATSVASEVARVASMDSKVERETAERCCAAWKNPSMFATLGQV